MMNKILIDQLRNPEKHFPGNFETPKKANALLMTLCDDAAQALEQQAQQEPVIGKGKELSEQLKLCARNVAFVAAGRVDMSSAAMQEMFALIDHVCVGIDSPPSQRTWVNATTWRGLTDEEIYMQCPNWLSQEQCKAWIQQVETKLKEKNT